MSVQGIPPGGLKTIGQIVGTNELRFHAAQNGLAIAVEICPRIYPARQSSMIKENSLALSVSLTYWAPLSQANSCIKPRLGK